jgi:hypothetical protein
MKNKIIILVAIAFSALLSACKTDEGPFGDKGVDWYTAHTSERAEQMSWCRNQAMSVQMNSAGCTQAHTATSMSFTKGKMPAGY